MYNTVRPTDPNYVYLYNSDRKIKSHPWGKNYTTVLTGKVTVVGAMLVVFCCWITQLKIFLVQRDIYIQ